MTASTATTACVNHANGLPSSNDTLLIWCVTLCVDDGVGTALARPQLGPRGGPAGAAAAAGAAAGAGLCVRRDRYTQHNDQSEGVDCALLKSDRGTLTMAFALAAG